MPAMGTTSRDASCIRKSGKLLYITRWAPSTYHSRTWKRIPTEPDTIAVLDIAPLILQRLKIHGGLKMCLCTYVMCWEIKTES